MASFRQPVLIYNPAAGALRRNPQSILQRTIAALAGGGLSPRLVPTSGPGTAGSLAQEAVRQGADVVLVLGGDGTVNEVIQGLAHSNVPLGVLPAGTANVLAMELGLGSRAETAAGKLAAFEPRPVALGRITGVFGSRYFLLMSGAGLDANIVYEVSAGLKNAVGKLAYWAAGFSRFFSRVEQLDVQVDGAQVHTCGFALISRVRNYGGDLEIASGASLHDDDFEVVLFEGSNPLRYAWYMLNVAARRVQRMRGVRVLRAHQVVILTETPVQIDGEYLGRQAVSIEIVPGALYLLLPPRHG
ncbi:MAG TPA: diacylglycerol kinase family protein [Bryobacteraceae bacterium]|nr:diacylglycerol kinase family protein [Bryobacteraceae bacterium]